MFWKIAKSNYILSLRHQATDTIFKLEALKAWYNLRGTDTVSGTDNSVEMVLLSFCKGVNFKRKEFAPKFFPFKVDPFLEEDRCTGKSTGSNKSYQPS